MRDESSADAAAAGSAAAATGGGGLIATAKKAKNQLTNPVRKTLFRHAILDYKCIILPRQARDRLGEVLKRDALSAGDRTR